MRFLVQFNSGNILSNSKGIYSIQFVWFFQFLVRFRLSRIMFNPIYFMQILFFPNP